MDKKISKTGVRERIGVIIKYLKLSGRSFSKACGFSESYYTTINDGISAEKLNKIVSVFPQISLQWLVTGQGNMLKDTPDTSSHNQAIQEYNELLQRHKELNSEYIALSRELRESNKEIRELRKQLDEERAAKQAAELRIAHLELQLAIQKKATEHSSAQHGDTHASPSNNL